MAESKVTKVLFVCLGNICRSPAAQAVFEEMAKRQHLAEAFHVDSAGLLDYHEGELPDPRMRRVASKRGYCLSHRSRPVTVEDLQGYDYVIAMDGEILQALQAFAREKGLTNYLRRIYLFLDFAGPTHAGQDVPDPYWSEEKGFEEVLDLIEIGCRQMLKRLAEDGRTAT
ncbi:MAG: low molecular weight phosphotyrosine protein phosphatase [Candidatus Sumerlaeaceae bacterium]|nr:low molecular weight phosphotyrosine protein phosphatase [Candidatus Sumerlaeaceae bacterium]